MNESHVLRMEVGRGKAPLREREHALAGIDAGDLRVRELAAEHSEKLSGPFAEDKDGSGREKMREMLRAANLQFAAGQERFHPAVVRRDEVEAHSAMEMEGREGRKCHQAQAKRAPSV